MGALPGIHRPPRCGSESLVVGSCAQDYELAIHKKTCPRVPTGTRSQGLNARSIAAALPAALGSCTDLARLLRSDGMIRKLKSGQYRLYSRKIDSRTGRRRNLGTFGTLAAAQKHERAVQFFKHR